MNRARSPLAPMKALASARLARFLPTDSGYAPFGWRWLRGLNVLPIALLGFVCLLSGGVEELAQQVSFRDTGALMPSLVDALGHLPAQLVMPLVTLMPMVMAAVVAINLTERRSSGVRIAALVLAVGLGASLTPLLWSGVGCAVGEWPCKERPI